MMSIVSAIFAGLALSVSAVVVRKKLNESNAFCVALVVTIIGNIILWPLALLFTNLRMLDFESVLFFVLAGILAPGLTRIFYFKGMKTVGVSVNASIFATYPLYSSIFAVLLLGEVLTPENWIGTICIVVGAVSVERSLSKPRMEPKLASRNGLVFPLLASLTDAISYIARKQGLNICNEPLLGVAIGYTSSVILYLLIGISSNSLKSSLFLRKDFRLFWKAAVCSSFGWVAAFYSLSQERISVTTPLIQIQPLFVLLFAYLYLKELERISFELVISTLFIIVGAILVSSI